MLLPALLGGLILLLPRGIPLRILGLAGFLLMFFFMPEKPISGAMKVTVLDEGQGLSVVVQTANYVLIYDNGPTFCLERDAGNRIILPFLQGEGVRKIDGMVISHDDKGHSGGAQTILHSFPVEWLASSFDLQEYALVLTKQMRCWVGQRWVWDHVEFEMLSPFEADNIDALKDNNKSCVLKISSWFGSLLLAVDIEKEA